MTHLNLALHHHPPEVVDSVGQRTLAGNIGIAPASSCEQTQFYLRLWIQIRIQFPSCIRIQERKNFKQNQKKCKEIGNKKLQFIQIFKVNLQQPHCFFLLSNLQ